MRVDFKKALFGRLTVRKRSVRLWWLLCLLLFIFAGTVSSTAAVGNIDGRAIYEARCAWCHGSDGTGFGVAARYMNPPPRDFSMGEFKWKSTEFGNDLPSEKELYSFIAGLADKQSHWGGLNGTSMPGWSDILTDAEIKAVAGYVKELAYITEPLRVKTIDLSGRVSSTEQSRANGKKLFEDRCAECHGKYGRGNASKRLKDDSGERTWPRNLTKPWLFRAGSDADDIFTRISIGVAGTQMPPFADPRSRKSLSETERWDVANYAVTLSLEYKEPVAGAVIKAVKIDGALPDTASSLKWLKAKYASFYTIPQIITKQRLYTPSIDSISVKALYNKDAVALLLEWDDPTHSLPGDRDSESIAAGTVFADSVAVQFPTVISFDDSPAADTPYFGMGDVKRAVDIWRWFGPGSTTGEGVEFIEATGVGKIEIKDGAGAGVTGTGVYDEGTWRVVISRTLTKWGGSGQSAVLGATVPVAFALWDGSNEEFGSKHTLTPWVALAFETKTDMMLYILPAFLFILVLGIEIVWLANIEG